MTGQFFPRLFKISLLCAALITAKCFAPAPTSAQSQQFPGPQMTMDDHSVTHRVMTDQEDNPGVRSDGLHLSPGQRARIVRANFQTSKHDAAELATLAKELREELNKPDAKTISLEVLNRAEKIQKLAKKIREETKGF